MTGRDRRPEYVNARSIGAQTHKIYRGDCLGLGVLVVTAAAGLSISFDCSIHVRWVEKKPLGTPRRLIVVSLSDRVKSRVNYRPRKQSLRFRKTQQCLQHRACFFAFLPFTAGSNSLKFKYTTARTFRHPSHTKYMLPTPTQLVLPTHKRFPFRLGQAKAIYGDSC